MKKKLPLAAAAVLVAAAAGIWFFQSHVRIGGKFYPGDSQFLDLRGTGLTAAEYEAARERLPDCEILWDIPFQEAAYPMDTREITVRTLSREDLEALKYLPQLERVDGTDCPDTEVLLELQRQRPEIAVSYRVEVCGQMQDSLARTIAVENAAASELEKKLPYFPNLTRVTLSGVLPEAGALTALRERFPEIAFSWEVELAGRRIPWDTRELDLRGAELESREALERQLAYLPELERLDLRGCGLPQEDLRAIADTWEKTEVLFDITVASVTVPADTRELDLSGIPMADTREVEAALPYFTQLERVIMCDTGISDGEMDALGSRHPEVRFVWTVTVLYRQIRTDATYYTPYSLSDATIRNARNQDIEALRYCVDMVAVDVGHMQKVDSCAWAANMPKLRYLVIADTGISYLTPLSGLKELVFLEIFISPVEDYSPLLGCTALEDLNLGRTYGDPEPLTRMTWLKHLWWSNLNWGPGRKSDRAPELLPPALPDTQILFSGAHPTADGWRKLPNYYAMRDALHMFYME